MIARHSFIASEGGIRLDAALLLECPSASRAFVIDAIRNGRIEVRRKGTLLRIRKGMRLVGGESITVHNLLEGTDNLVRPEPDAPLPPTVFADDALLAFDKPAGMPVQPLSCMETGTLMNAVVARHPECRPLGDRPLLAGALHRIDADTSGLVLVARSAEAFSRLREQFTAQTVRKTYLALVEGKVTEGGNLSSELIHDPTLPFCRMIDIRRARMTRDAIAKARPLHAETRYLPIGTTRVESETRTLLEVTIHTGVTHQIRAQLSEAGMHIVNDRLYGGFAVEGQKGHCLHAIAASFIHPISNEEMTIETPKPAWARFN